MPLLQQPKWRVIAAGAAPCLENKWYQGWYGNRHLRSPPFGRLVYYSKTRDL